LLPLIAIARRNGNAMVVIPQGANRAFEIQATTNLIDGNSWSALNRPSNAPFFPSSNRTAVGEETIQPVRPGSIAPGSLSPEAGNSHLKSAGRFLSSAR